MGTTVFPDAIVKVFLTASAEVRAERRYKQLREKGFDVNLPRLLDEIRSRDARDVARSASPLKPAADAHLLDTSDLSISEVVDRIELPVEPILKAAASKAGLVPASAGGMTLGYGVVMVRGEQSDLRLLSHELRHVAQYEACGGIAPFLSRHLAHLAEFGYRDSPFERDARASEPR